MGDNGTYWNYRIVKKFGTYVDKDFKEDWVTYGIHEVYYKNDKPWTLTADEISPCGETYEEFLESWKWYQLAFNKPILIYDYDQDKFL